MIIDGHAHIFNSLIIDNVIKKNEMMERLHLEQAHERSGTMALESAMKTANINACLVLPTANAENIKKINSNFIKIARNTKNIFTAGTLHPDYDDNKNELERFKKTRIKAIKLCSFSQGFSLRNPQTQRLLKLIEDDNNQNGSGFFIIFDTFYNANIFFGTSKENNTTPLLLGEIVRSYPKINFVGAHMGGLDAPFKEIIEYLKPCDNLYLDTSNAAHTLDEKDFVSLLKTHGPEHIIFGTDWPWFNYNSEIVLIKKLLDKAGYSKKQQDMVFAENIAKLLEIN